MANILHVCLLLLVFATIQGVPSKRGRSRPLFVGKRYPPFMPYRRTDYNGKRGRLQLLFVGKRQPTYEVCGPYLNKYYHDRSINLSSS